MKEEQKFIGFDECEEGAMLTALNDLRNKEIENKEPTDFLDGLLLKILHAPQRKVRVRNESR